MSEEIKEVVEEEVLEEAELDEELASDASEETIEEEAEAVEEAPAAPKLPGKVRKLAYRYQEVRDDVDKICERCGRDPKEVKIIAVSKTLDSREVLEAIYAGMHDFAENRPEVLEEKAKLFFKENWHYIGRIQTKKVRHIGGFAKVIESIYDIKHLNLIIQRNKYFQTEQEMYLQVNTSGEEQKAGIEARRASSIIAPLSNYRGLNLTGLMTMGVKGDREKTRECFRTLRELKDQLNEKWEGKGQQNVKITHLSMGMSDDYDIAIEEGATEIRLGRVLFDDAYIAKWREERGIVVDESQFEDPEPEEEIEELEDSVEAEIEEATEESGE